jgi:hypothetical protein
VSAYRESGGKTIKGAIRPLALGTRPGFEGFADRARHAGLKFGMSHYPMREAIFLPQNGPYRAVSYRPVSQPD